MREKPYDGDNFKGKFEIQEKPLYKKRFSYEFPFNFSKANTNRGPNIKTQGGKVGGSSNESPNVPNVSRGT